MPKWRKLYLVAGVTLSVLALILFPKNKEPRYHGHSLAQWLTRCTTPTSTLEQVHQGEDAVRHIGTNAIPYLIRWVASEPRPRENFVTSLLPASVRGLFFALTTKRDKQYRYRLGVKGFELLGEDAAPAVPELTRMLNDTNSVLRRQNGAVALASTGITGLPPLLHALSNTNYPQRETVVAVVPLIKDPVPVIPLLIRCSQESDPTLAGMSVQALGRFQIQLDSIVPAITNAFRHPDGSVRFIAVQCFVTWLDAEAYRAAPGLQNLLNDPEVGVRDLASNLLTKIKNRASRNVPPY